MEQITGKIKIEKTKNKKVFSLKNLTELKKTIEKNLYSDTSTLFETIIGGSIIIKASDLHLEPQEEKVRMRLRIDGVLYDAFFFEPQIYRLLLSRIKLVSGIKLNITDRAQDGRFSILFENREIEVRVSTLPSEFGETVVMRFLDPQNLIEVEQLGIREDMFEVFERQIHQPNGMIIVTGPTGSGKTTTLYAILKRLQSPEIKIITIEDPIEYRLEGISQTQVNPKKGYDFANGLRAIVRQDPDVILVGEIRDFETAKIALQAALTGHLVLSTLHTNDAAGTIARLQALGEKPTNIAPAINLAIAQRLVRKICKKCVQKRKIKPSEYEILSRELKGLPKTIKMPPLNKKMEISEPKGCKECNFSGYKGRIGIFEFFLVDEEMENFILKSPSISELRKMAEKKGMVSMRKDGLIKVVKGITTIEEINRVTRQ